METNTEKSKAGLTAKRVAALKSTGKRRDVFDSGQGRVRGLTLRITASGHKSWTCVYRVEGVKKRWTIGAAEHIGLASARRKAESALRKLREDGIDPATAKSIDRGAPTFADLATEFEKVKKPKKRSWGGDASRLKKLVPLWKNRKLTAITSDDLEGVLDAIVSNGHPIEANRTHALLATMFNHAIRKKKWLAVNPASSIDKQEEVSRERVLTNDEIRTFWQVLEAQKTIRADDDDPPVINPMVARVLQGILLTGQRPGEVGRMKWADVDSDSGWWTVPSAVAKNKSAHRVPLSSRALDLLAEAREHGPADNQYVFGGIKGGSVAARSVKAIAKLRAAGLIASDYHRHDLRRTTATKLAEAGVPRDIVAALLNHKLRGGGAVTAIYDRYSYDAEKAAAIKVWQKALDQIIAGREAARVVKFARAAR